MPRDPFSSAITTATTQGAAEGEALRQEALAKAREAENYVTQAQTSGNPGDLIDKAIGAALAAIAADAAMGAATGAKIGAFLGPQGAVVGGVVGGIVGGAVGVWTKYGAQLRHILGAEEGVPPEVMRQLHAPVEFLGRAVQLSNNPAILQQIADGCSRANDALARWEADNTAIMDDGDHAWFNVWSRELAQIQQEAARKRDAFRAQRGARFALTRGVQQAVRASVAERRANARGALRAARDVLSHVETGDRAALELVRRLHDSAHTSLPSAKASALLSLAVTLPPPVWAHI